MPVVAAAAIPAILELGRLQADVEEVLASLPPFDGAVLLAGGGEQLLHDVGTVESAPQGGPARRADVLIDTDLLMAIARRGQAPRVQERSLGGELAALALRLEHQHPGTHVVPMTVPTRASASALDGIAVGIEAAVRAVGQDVVVVAAADLACPQARRDHDLGQPAPVLGAGQDLTGGRDDGADRRWDEQAADAVAGSDAASLRSLGPTSAQAVGAAGWAPLSVLLGVLDMAGLRVTRSTYQLAGDAGRLVALALPEPGERRRREPVATEDTR